MRRALLLPFFLITFLTTAGLSATEPPPSTFESASCPFTLPPGVREGRQVSCGTVTVPEVHAEPEGKQISIGVAILHSSADNPAPDPLVMLHGGPGGSMLDDFAPTLLTPQYGATLVAERDLILIEFRGALHSQPDLLCEEIKQVTVDTLSDNLSRDESLAITLDVVEDCRTRLLGEGINLSAYNGVEMAADIAAVVVALGIESYNLYGVSYGTAAAQHLMRDYPAGLRSVILDGVVPLELEFYQMQPLTIDAGFTALFEACAAHADCKQNYPNLPDVFFKTLDALDANPVVIPSWDYSANVERDMLLNGRMFYTMMIYALYADYAVPELPSAIYAAADGSYEWFYNNALWFLLSDTFSDGLFFSGACAEDNSFEPLQIASGGRYPALVEMVSQDNAEFLDVCALWGVTELPPLVDMPVSSDIPTLLLSGYFDPVTPPYYADMVAAHLPNSYNFTRPDGAHGQLFNPCTVSIMLAFLDDPNTAPDASCLARSGVDFR